MSQHRAPRTRTPPLIVSGFACSLSAIGMFFGIPASMWWGLAGWAFATVGVFASVAGAGWPDDPTD